MNNLSVRMACWRTDNAALRRIREQVFIAEQGVSPELEWDGEDSSAIHFLALDDHWPIGTARLSLDGHISRVCVLKDWRDLGVGEKILQTVIAEAERRGLDQQRLSAQVQATPFYQKQGFVIESPEFLDAGIAHVDMLRQSL
ncbi:GNAT family acetyltransferase [Ventosimonas gracilis]|uniref:GNAT family acetyltransferase n=1 Tax=Ventosimonas gracilis TaxID=1680762 RepID=A0A139SXM2_9GAMM|nr:GNAT family N-acetyltransferase [Ventosimonas gracilis]KXU39152.1 GNAT family acetyltransferase [Ventosimonas gracilis]